jgi:hypothetical protein
MQQCMRLFLVMNDLVARQQRMGPARLAHSQHRHNRIAMKLSSPQRSRYKVNVSVLHIKERKPFMAGKGNSNRGGAKLMKCPRACGLSLG